MMGENDTNERDSDRPKVYLAGPMNHVDDHGRGWREDLIESDGDEIDFLNPLDLNEEHDFEDDAVPVWVADEDIEMVREADHVIAYLPFDVPSRGTAVEIWEGGKCDDTTVIGWVDAPRQAYSPFVRGSVDVWVGSIDAALSYIGQRWAESDDATAVRTDGGVDRNGSDHEIYWGKPADARKPHLFDGQNLARSLCRSWGFYSTYASDPIDIEDPDPGYDLDDLCVRCLRKARSLHTGSDQ